MIKTRALKRIAAAVLSFALLLVQVSVVFAEEKSECIKFILLEENGDRFEEFKETVETPEVFAIEAEGEYFKSVVDENSFEILSADDGEYGYSFLNDTQKKVYRIVEECVKNSEKDTEIDYDFALTPEMLSEAVEMFTADHPEYFWFLGAYGYSYVPEDGVIVGFYPVYKLGEKEAEKVEIDAANAVFCETLDKIISQMNTEVAEKNDYLKALWLHDKVAEMVDYKYGNNHQTAYGALVEGEAVCMGYTRAYQCLLKRAGIGAWSVKGASIKPGSSDTVAHAWTLMWLDSCCVYTDVTWDDQGEDLYHIYFARDIDAMSTEHVLEEKYYADRMPEGNKEDCCHMGYFEKVDPEHMVSDEITAEEIGAMLFEKRSGRTWSAAICDASGEKFKAWISESDNLYALINAALPYGRYIFKMRCLGVGIQGTEAHLIIENVPDKTNVQAKISEDNKKCNVSVSLEEDDISKDASVIMAFYDKDGRFVGAVFKSIANINEDYEDTVIDGASYFKAMVIENGSISPLCGAQGCEIE